MDLTVTAALAVFCIAGAAFCAWRGAQPAQIGKPRMMPWRFLMIAFVGLLLFLIVHLVNLAGVTTGNGRLR
ncbi:MAG: hypothetical protein ACXW3D_07635 [Caulobacteraceae bacterium]